MIELSWLNLSNTIKKEEIKLRVVFSELPKREGRCLAELFVDRIDGVITNPSRLLDPKYKLSLRQMRCVNIFISAANFSAKKDIYLLNHSQAVNILLLCNDIIVEVKNRGVVLFSDSTAYLEMFIQEDLVGFNAVSSPGCIILNPIVLGVDEVVIMDDNLKIYRFQLAILPEEVQLLLQVKKIELSSLRGSEICRTAIMRISGLGVDMSCLEAYCSSAISKIVLRAFFVGYEELRLHLVNVMSFNGRAEEVEIKARGILESFYIFSNGEIVKRIGKLEHQARQFVVELGALPSCEHSGYEIFGEKALDFLTKISNTANLPEWLTLDTECLPEFVSLPDKPTIFVDEIAESQFEIKIGIGKTPFSLEKLLEVASRDKRSLFINNESILVFSEKTASSLKTISESFNFKNFTDVKHYSFLETALGLKALNSNFILDAKQSLREKLQNFIPELQSNDFELPKSLITTLRPYQHDAVIWMSQLDRAGLGGLLADEMGLGKTLMILCLIAKSKEQEGVFPSLVVAPTSVLDVWIAESGRHFIGLKVIKWHGAGRFADYNLLKHADLIVTSYTILRSDIDKLSKINLRYFIVDEAQLIKNSRTESWKSARLIQSKQRLALSGTPIENRISDLYSIFELITPGVLGNEKVFISRYGSSEKNDELRNRIRPMILRRKKQDVEKDLPAKIENILYCDLSDKQQQLYCEILRSAKKELNYTNNTIPLLAALTRLRQVCCDPKLILGDDEVSISSKLDLFAEVVQSCLLNSRRIIVYSQFVKMQMIILRTLSDIGVKNTLWLHGGTRNRGAIVEDFQNPEGPNVILVSLKAGGTGITLTAADTIIYYDPWWNPAVMDQAADRAHRIGQTKTVHLIKLICKNTIEEQILKLCDRKRKIADGILFSDRSGVRALSADDIRRLLRFEIDRVI